MTWSKDMEKLTSAFGLDGCFPLSWSGSRRWLETLRNMAQNRGQQRECYFVCLSIDLIPFKNDPKTTGNHKMCRVKTKNSRFVAFHFSRLVCPRFCKISFTRCCISTMLVLEPVYNIMNI